MTSLALPNRAVPSLLLLIGLIALPQLGETIYTPSLANLAQYFQVDARGAQSTLTLFFIGFSVGIFIWGAVSDARGRRPAMLMALAVYVTGCVLCLLAADIGQLLVGRFIQGAGAAACSVVVQAVCREAFRGDRQLQVFAVIGTFIPLSTALGPFAGGWLAMVTTWWASFIVLLLAGMLLWAGSLAALPETRQPALSPAASFLTLLRKMAGDRRLLGMTLLIGLPNGIVFSFYGEAPFLLIERRGLSSGEYGTLCMLAVNGSIAGGWLLRRLSRRGWDSRKLIGLGLGMLTLASGLLLATAPAWSAPDQPAALALFTLLGALLFAGFTLCTTACLHRALEDYQSALGRAGALFGLAYYLIVAATTEGMSMLHNGSAATFPAYALALSLVAVAAFLGIVRSRLGRPALIAPGCNPGVVVGPGGANRAEET